MPDRSKKPRKPWTGVHPQRPSRERRGAVDRRQQAKPKPTSLSYGDRRRADGRRRTDLRRNRWAGLLIAGVLGVGAAVAAQHLVPGIPAGDSQPVRVPARVFVASVQTLAEAEALRDAAEGLTPTEVLLDERARDLWLPRLPELQRTADGPNTPAAVKTELAATLAALDAVGIHP